MPNFFVDLHDSNLKGELNFANKEMVKIDNGFFQDNCNSILIGHDSNSSIVLVMNFLVLWDKVYNSSFDSNLDFSNYFKKINHQDVPTDVKFSINLVTMVHFLVWQDN